jgi:predicted transcriptional regulator
MTKSRGLRAPYIFWTGVDLLRLKALRQAGKSLDTIAREMKKDRASVYRYIRQMEEAVVYSWEAIKRAVS